VLQSEREVESSVECQKRGQVEAKRDALGSKGHERVMTRGDRGEVGGGAGGRRVEEFRDRGQAAVVAALHEAQRFARLFERAIGNAQALERDLPLDARLRGLQLGLCLRAVGSARGRAGPGRGALPVGHVATATKDRPRRHHAHRPVRGAGEGLIDGRPVGARHGSDGGEPGAVRACDISACRALAQLGRLHVASRVDAGGVRPAGVHQRRDLGRAGQHRGQRARGVARRAHLHGQPQPRDRGLSGRAGATGLELAHAHLRQQHVGAGDHAIALERGGLAHMRLSGRDGRVERGDAGHGHDRAVVGARRAEPGLLRGAVGHGGRGLGGESGGPAAEQCLWGEQRLLEDECAGGEGEGVGAIQSRGVEVGLRDRALPEPSAEDADRVGGANGSALDPEVGEEAGKGRCDVGAGGVGIGSGSGRRVAIAIDGAEDFGESERGTIGSSRLGAQGGGQGGERSQQPGDACRLVAPAREARGSKVSSHTIN
jgi:hypothetical protein